MHRCLQRTAVAALCLSSFNQCLRSQYTNELREFYTVIAPFQAHVAIKARPNCLITKIPIPVFHISLHNKPGIEIGVVPGNGADHSTLAAVKAEMYPGIFYFLFMMRHGFYILLSSLLHIGYEIFNLLHKALTIASR